MRAKSDCFGPFTFGQKNAPHIVGQRRGGHLSQLILRALLGQNFFEFINAYRVSELKEKLENPENRQFTLLSLAFDCGFNSKTTFNTAFKRITGCTPSQYIKQIA